jgi:hypothetical protein
MSAEVIRVERMAIALPIQQVFSLLPAQSISSRFFAAE